MGKPKQRALTAIARQLCRRNVVVRNVCDSDGNYISTVIEAHDGTESGIITAAQTATQRMYTEYPAACNVESGIGATDDDGRPKWTISPNVRYLAEIGTEEVRYIGGDTKVDG